MPVAILYSEALKEYDFGPGHPFRGDRYEIFPRFLKKTLAEDGNYRMLEAEMVDDQELAMVCQRDYIEFTRYYYVAAHLGLVYDADFHTYHSMDNRPIGKPGKLEAISRPQIHHTGKNLWLLLQVFIRRFCSECIQKEVHSWSLKQSA